jgi:tRNA pseudouridine55 synthase
VSRRGATDLLGILPVDKPSGMTSHDVVARIRRLTGEGRVGHAGTLDPLATGLLVVLIGPYARLAPFLTSARKSYKATIAFGTETDTDDSEGVAMRTAAVPPELLDPAYAQRVLDGFLGRSMQMPPAYSAIKVGGTIAYRAARSGEPLDLEAREIEVVGAALRSIDAATHAWDVDFVVSKGTYVRALARDIGRACGSAAHLSALRRTASGALSLADAHTLEEITAAAETDTLAGMLVDPVAALGLPVVETNDPAVAHGGVLEAPASLTAPEGSMVAVTAGGSFAGVYGVTGGGLRPAAVFASGGAM